MYLETAGLSRGWTEEVRFRVKAVNNRWKIVEPMFPPHVGQKRMVNFVREALLKETDRAKRDRSGRCRTSCERQNDGENRCRFVDFRSGRTLIESKWDIADIGESDVGRTGGAAAATRGNLWVCGGWGEKTVAIVGRRREAGLFDEALRVFRGQYLAHCLDRTTFYPGIERC